jgi:hypothetical protein
VGSTGYTRYSGTDMTGSRENKAILFGFTDGTTTINLMMNNVWFTKDPEISLTADGHVEVKITAVSLISDWYVEDNI